MNQAEADLEGMEGHCHMGFGPRMCAKLGLICSKTLRIAFLFNNLDKISKLNQFSSVCLNEGAIVKNKISYLNKQELFGKY